MSCVLYIRILKMCVRLTEQSMGFCMGALGSSSYWWLQALAVVECGFFFILSVSVTRILWKCHLPSLTHIHFSSIQLRALEYFPPNANMSVTQSLSLADVTALTSLPFFYISFYDTSFLTVLINWLHGWNSESKLLFGQVGNKDISILQNGKINFETGGKKSYLLLLRKRNFLTVVRMENSYPATEGREGWLCIKRGWRKRHLLLSFSHI